MPGYRYDRRGEAVLATGHLSREESRLKSASGITIGGRRGIVDICSGERRPVEREPGH